MAKAQTASKARKKVKKKVSIPAGVDMGTQIRLNGEGAPGENGGPQGSLFLVLDVKPHKFFKRRDQDLILNLDINIAQAALGAEVADLKIWRVSVMATPARAVTSVNVPLPLLRYTCGVLPSLRTPLAMARSTRNCANAASRAS